VGQLLIPSLFNSKYYLLVMAFTYSVFALCKPYTNLKMQKKIKIAKMQERAMKDVE
jgi:uncharacterized membrane protein